MLFSQRMMIVTVLCSITISILFTNCQKTEEVASTSSQPSTTAAGPNIPDEGCALAASNRRNPITIDAVVDLINALPKPLTLTCFLKNLPGNYQIFATSSINSVQPAGGPESPRILFLRGTMIFSVVPAGNAKDEMEVSQVISAERSVKGDFIFPITANIPNDYPYSRILLAGGGGTTCGTCHTSEITAGAGFRGQAFANDIATPDNSLRVFASKMRAAYNVCDPIADLYRCRMLKTIYIDGKAVDVNFPY